MSRVATNKPLWLEQRIVLASIIIWSLLPASLIASAALPIPDEDRGGLQLALFIFGTPLCALGTIGWTVYLASARHWVMSLISLAVCWLLISTFFPDTAFSALSKRIWQPVYDAVDLIHFGTVRRRYDDDIARSHSHLRVFLWEANIEGGWAVVYDDSDKINSPGIKLSRPSYSRIADMVLGEICKVRPLAKHYYLVSFGC